ncbi:MAG: hypothetical protein M3Q69_02255 [Acidobacteriota bacterium]|nr:hypothetical protein [Acidobacteriota bacterium]
MPDNSAGSSLLLDEYFDAGDERFLDELFRSTAEKKLGAFAQTWYRATRPFARAALLRYIDDGCDRAHHRALVKHLFKLAEAAGDDEAMGRFMVAFDRLMRRHLKQITRYDWQSREIVTSKALRADPSLPADQWAAQRESRFSRATRKYLARRAWRYFRYHGYRDPQRYARAMRATLPHYADADLESSAELLDSWGLMHALYWASPVLQRRPGGIVVAPGAMLSQLQPAPFQAEVWKDFDALMEMLEASRSRTVRTWTLQWLREHFAEELKRLPLARIVTFLRSPHDELQLLGVELLGNAEGLQTMPVEQWLDLLRIENLEVVARIAELMAKHVAPERLTSEQLTMLAIDRAAPVAELAFGWLETRPVRNASELQLVMRLTNAQVPLVRERAAKWLLGFAQSPFFEVTHVREMLDSRFEDVRAAALAFALNDTRFSTDERIWQSLAESPYDDMRGALIAHLEAVEEKLERSSIRHVWATTLLAIHRGGRVKKQVIAQIASRIAATTNEANDLLPLLAISLRSVRPPERRAALGALAQAAYRTPALRQAIASAIPELVLFPEEAA